MMNHHMIERLEIAFWNTTIPAMTGVRSLRHMLNQSRVALLRIVPAHVFLQSVVWSGIGLIFGLLLGFISSGL